MVQYFFKYFFFFLKKKASPLLTCSRELIRINVSGFSLFCSRRICFCSLGFPRNLQSPNSKNVFLQEVIRVEEFLKDPWGVRVSREGTVQVPVPRVAPVPAGDGGGGGDAVEEEALVSAQAKRLALQRKAAAAMVAAEDYARKVESGDIAVIFLHLTLCICLGICLFASARYTISFVSEF